MIKFRVKVIVFFFSVFVLVIGFVFCLNFGVVIKEMDRNIINEMIEIWVLEVLFFLNDIFLFEFKKGKCVFVLVLLCGNLWNLGEIFYEVYNIIYVLIYVICGIVVIIFYVIIYYFIFSWR